eukprot:6847600-Alexandrium_andersonii.AAC.1
MSASLVGSEMCIRDSATVLSSPTGRSRAPLWRPARRAPLRSAWTGEPLVRTWVRESVENRKSAKRRAPAARAHARGPGLPFSAPLKAPKTAESGCRQKESA